MRVICIYASASGNTELVVKKIAEIVQSKGMDVEIHKAEVVDLEVLNRERYFVFATSTWGHGEINPYFNRVLNWMTEVDLSSKYAGMVGLGDPRYEPVYVCAGIDVLSELYLQRGGVQLGSTLKIQGEPHSKLDTVVSEWVEDFFVQIKNHVDV